MIPFFKRLFRGRVNRKNFFAAVLTLVVFGGLINFGAERIFLKWEDQVFMTSANRDYDDSKLGDDVILSDNFESIISEQTILEANKIDNARLIFGLVFESVILFLIFTLNYRRLQDFNKSGLIALITFLPLINQYLIVINIIFLLVLLFKKGDVVANKYGEVDIEKDIFKVIVPRNR